MIKRNVGISLDKRWKWNVIVKGIVSKRGGSYMGNKASFNRNIISNFKEVKDMFFRSKFSDLEETILNQMFIYCYSNFAHEKHTVSLENSI